MLSAPKLALIRMAAVLTASGVPVTDEQLVARTVTARGILLNPFNRSRYAVDLEGLVESGHLVAVLSTELDGRDLITVAELGAQELARQVDR